MLGDPAANIIFGGTDKVTPVIRKVGAEVKGFQKTLGGVGGAIPVFDKLAAATGGLITPTTLAIGGAVALGGALIGAAKAAATEQINVAKLDASLRANVAGWDGNTKAIEATIAAREKFAFSDDELRDSLALLVAATHDVDKAFAVQSTAMDLARLKGISLKDASTALVRVEGGQYRMLKGLGIVLKDGATQTEALAAVQKIAAGQTEAYSNTLIGKTEALDIKLHDLEETAGRLVTPILMELADSALQVATSFDEMTSSAGEADAGAAKWGDSWIGEIGNIVKMFADAPWPIGRKNTPNIDIGPFKDVLGGVHTEAKKFTRDLERDFDSNPLDLKAFYRPVWKQFDVAAFKASQAAKEFPGDLAQGILDGEGDIDSAMESLAEHMEIGKKTHAHLQGVLIGKDLAKGLQSQNPNIAAEARAIRLKILQQLAAYYFFRGGVNAGKSFNSGLRTSTGGNRNPNVRAKGGPVTKGVAYIVGEERPEVFVPNQSGKILPDINTLPPMATGGVGPAPTGAGTIINVSVNSSGVMTPSAAQKLANDLGPTIATYLRRQNLIPARV